MTTSPQTLHDLIVQVQPQRIVFETCSIAGWVHDLCESLHIPEIQIANPNGEPSSLLPKRPWRIREK